MADKASPVSDTFRIASWNVEGFTDVNEDNVLDTTDAALSHLPPANHPHTAAPPQHDFIVLHKNARSLHNDDSIDELLTELQHTPWHIVAINETWRTNRRELWTTKHDQHTFAGSGHDDTT